jgi:hypothetical protein
MFFRRFGWSSGVVSRLLAERFWWLSGFPLYRLRHLIGERPYGWAHVRWLNAYVRRTSREWQA